MSVQQSHILHKSTLCNNVVSQRLLTLCVQSEIQPFVILKHTLAKQTLLQRDNDIKCSIPAKKPIAKEEGPKGTDTTLVCKFKITATLGAHLVSLHNTAILFELEQCPCGQI